MACSAQALICGWGRKMRCSMARDFSQAFSFPARRLLVRFASSKSFIGGLSFDTNETALRDAFAEHGEIVQVKVICDRMSSKSKGYGFVQFSSQEEAAMALQKMHGESLDARNIRVEYAEKEG